jgi:hypothetical protein
MKRLYWRSSLNCATGEHSLWADPTTLATPVQSTDSGQIHTAQTRQQNAQADFEYALGNVLLGGRPQIHSRQLTQAEQTAQRLIGRGVSAARQGQHGIDDHADQVERCSRGKSRSRNKHGCSPGLSSGPTVLNGGHVLS